MSPGFAPVYFADENVLGFGKLMRDAGREDVLFPGHPGVAQIPLGTLDVDWMPMVGRLDLIVVSRDRRIRSRPAELAAYRENGIRSVWMAGRRDLSSGDVMRVFLAQEQRLRRLIIRLGRGPWAVAMTSAGVRPLGLRDRST